MGLASFRIGRGRAIISSVCPSYCTRLGTGERGQLRTWLSFRICAFYCDWLLCSIVRCSHFPTPRPLDFCWHKYQCQPRASNKMRVYFVPLTSWVVLDVGTRSECQTEPQASCQKAIQVDPLISLFAWDPRERGVGLPATVINAIFFTTTCSTTDLSCVG